MDTSLRKNHRAFQGLDRASREGDLTGPLAALGEPPDFPNCVQPQELRCGSHPLEYAIYWSPVAFIRRLLDLGADPNYSDAAGFPSLMATLSTRRPDKHELLAMLLDRGADPGQRGNNNWTPLHYAVALRDIEAVRVLLAHDADPTLRTNVDDHTTPMEDAVATGFNEAVALFASLPSEATAGRR